LQTVDDLLDGDLACPGEPLDRVAEGTRALVSADAAADAESADPMRRLAAAFRQDLEAVGGRAALDRALDLVDAMRLDRRRVLDGLLFDETQLREHHRRTFAGSLDLMLVAGGSPLRASDVPELVDALGWCSTLRDLDIDLERGLFNLPRHVVEEAGAEPSLAESDAARRWLEGGRLQALRDLDATDARLAALRGLTGAGILRTFARSIRRYARTPLFYSK
jgi:hypothetical protein